MQPQSSVPDTAQAAPSRPATDTTGSADASAKAFLAQTITRIEAAFAATASNPHLRAGEIHKIRAEYLKAKYNVEVKSSPHD